MAKIWFAKSGGEPTCGEAPYDMRLSECVARLGLKPLHYLCDLTVTPRFDHHRADGVAAPRHVVIEVSASEASAAGWKAGFYGLADISPLQATRLLSDQKDAQPLSEA